MSLQDISYQAEDLLNGRGVRMQTIAFTDICRASVAKLDALTHYKETGTESRHVVQEQTWKVRALKLPLCS